MMDVKRTLHQTNDKGLLINPLLPRRQILQGVTSTAGLFKADSSAQSMAYSPDSNTVIRDGMIMAWLVGIRCSQGISYESAPK